jgi:hypothetical protein
MADDPYAEIAVDDPYADIAEGGTDTAAPPVTSPKSFGAKAKDAGNELWRRATLQEETPQHGFGTTLSNVGARMTQNLGGMVRHPLDTISNMGEQVMEASKLLNPLAAPNQEPGPLEQRIQEFKDEYKVAPLRAIENAAGDFLSMYLAGKFTEAGMKQIGPKARALAEKSLELRRRAAQTVTNTTPEARMKLLKGLEAENVTADTKHFEEAEEAAQKGRATEGENLRAKQATEREAQKEARNIKEHNDALDQALALRRQKESELQRDTDAYYAKEDAVKAKAKTEENAAWQPWHEKMANVEIDGGEISTPLEKIAADSPEIRRELRQLTPTPEDAPPDSLYAQDRAAVMKAQGFSGDYWKLPADKRLQIDNICKSNGFEPEPIDFNPKAGEPISAEKVHRAKSIIGRNIAGGKYEGPLLGEMKQLFKALEQAESRATMKAGAMDDLTAARAATRKYQEAFGRERHTPTTQDEIREKTANPEAYRERADQERLAAAEKHDPTLRTDYEKVKAKREELKKMQTEEQLRKARKQESVSPEYAEPKNLEEPSDRPKPKDTSPEAIKNLQREKLNAKAQGIREYGVRRAIWSLGAAAPTAILTALVGHPGYAVGEIAVAVPAGISIMEMAARAMENPSLQDWLLNPPAKDIAKIRSMPLEQRTAFMQNLQPILDAAKAKGITVNPVLGVGAVLAGPKTRQLQDKSRELRQANQ